MNKQMNIGLVVGNRGFFPGSLVEEGRRRMISVLEGMGIKVIALSTQDTKYGAVESLQDAEKCAELFKDHADEIDGIIVTLPNFGDERSAATALRLSGLNVPVLVHAFADDLTKLGVESRRDSFCGKISLCNNLVQYGINFSDTTLHVEDPESNEFKQDLERFLAVCRIVKGLKNLKIGAIGARPAAFNTVRFSEKILEQYGISVETIDLSEIIALANAFDSKSKEVTRELEKLTNTFKPKGIPAQALEKMARLAAAMRMWVENNKIKALAFQCWTALEAIYGIVPCAVMSMFSESLIPSACEMDVMGALSMYVLQLASGTPSALMDWNNNYGNDPEKAIMFHCSNFPICFFDKCKMSYQQIIAGTVGKENTYGTCVGKVAKGPATFLRLSSFDTQGTIVGVIAEGEFTDDDPKTFGGYGVAHIPDLRQLLRIITQYGFEHHVAVNKNLVKEAVKEALEKYMGWEIFSAGHCDCH
ncbi:MAG TPA: L-fucose/L-arabinose isomerase family protein [Pseudothermotoga sp.]|nr:L-fucose/L-arabinose isomerase family protein [Pseudothermotoga sp.]HOK83682.1 L-fucose/L-arabinose isomerase family protein [Pseudothermotoga sp.]HPP69321.1 L-fucose/L-arabinose isomerase family protein [Pseudothermotoga sp.]